VDTARAVVDLFRADRGCGRVQDAQNQDRRPGCPRPLDAARLHKFLIGQERYSDPGFEVEDTKDERRLRLSGPFGYVEHFLAAIADPRHPEHKEMLGWIGGAFDPERFDLKGINQALARVGKRRKR